MLTVAEFVGAFALLVASLSLLLVLPAIVWAGKIWRSGMSKGLIVAIFGEK